MQPDIIEAARGLIAAKRYRAARRLLASRPDLPPGGLALLGGVLLIGRIVGSYDLDVVLASGDLIRASHLYPWALALVLLGIFTKSAQFPFHFWLPHAMAAPTPVSSYLHSATMVKAGVFILLRFQPALGGTELWFQVVTGAGLITLLLGALVFWLLSRRNAPQPAFRAPSAASPRVDAPAGPAAPAPVPVAGKPTWHATGAATSTVAAEPPPGAVDQRAEAMTASRRAAVTPAAIATAVPTAAGPTGDGEAVADALEDAQGQERIELARAYVELGDVETARTLLQEVVDCGTPAVRGEAAQLLSELA